MENIKIITANNQDIIWDKVGKDLEETALSYDTIIDFENSSVQVNIDIDPGGGFEGGFQITTLRSALHNLGDFKFAIHHQGLLAEIGKFFGMEDIETGYPEFDKKVIVKTNDPARVKEVFADSATRQVFADFADFKLHTTQEELEGSEGVADILELTIEEAIMETEKLRTIYNAFYAALVAIEK